ncbi:MAG: IS110-like element ISPa11 family transposase [Gammaproteobacteria bacterium]|nr:MAG: IS110-like element ISPa11 family transposase [Gammaproteobacteria bacterium]
MNITTLGIDIAKSVFQLHGTNEHGKVELRKRLRRDQLLTYMAKLPPCLVGMEACGGAHYWARKFQAYGHTVKLIAPQYVKPYVKTNKNDYNDAEGINEAVGRPSMRFVGIKALWQQDIQTLHRARSRLMQMRNMLSSHTRGLLAEYGIVIPKQIGQLRAKLPLILEDAANGLSASMRALFADLYEQLQELDKRLLEKDKQVLAIHRESELSQRLGEIEGVGPLTATAYIAAVGDAKVFNRGRDCSAWLGLVPRQYSTGGKTILGRISKRGDRYLRTNLIHGARSVISRADNKTDARSRWIQQLKSRVGMNKACVALANKNARIMWAIMASGERYRASEQV